MMQVGVSTNELSKEVDIPDSVPLYEPKVNEEIEVPEEIMNISDKEAIAYIWAYEETMNIRCNNRN